MMIKEVQPIERIHRQKGVTTTRVFRKYTPPKKQDVLPIIIFGKNNRIIDIYC
jgi:hypothetical protein